MPLNYPPNQSWPPSEWKPIYDKYAEWSAWYSGDPNKIANVFSSAVYTPTKSGRFWAREIKEERRVMLHIPIAGDLATTSSNLLFSESPKIILPGGSPELTAKLEQIINANGFYNTIIEAAEVCAALGGVFLKINWDKDLSPYPILNIAQVDNAIPEFKYGILQAVTFWKIIDAEDEVHRLLERHEKGYIYSALYLGTQDNLGRQIPLTSRPETANIQPVVATGINDILVRYIPNMMPNKLFRGSSVGQSDFGGSEGLMDALDEVYTSWIRDIRLGQARIIVPESYLIDVATGKPKFDLDQEVYVQMDYNPNDIQGANSITQSQFNIRTEEHRQTSLELIARIIANAGYSPQSFGLGAGSISESGYALQIREKKSFITTAKKARYWKTALEDILFLMLQLENHSHSIRPSVEIQDSVTSDLSQIAQTVNLLYNASAISIRTAVQMVNHDMSEEQIELETKRILAERGIQNPVPSQQA
ncbi:MAG TPA: phage portal protein [Bacillota bacterium]|nr:phage portal protein [Bacillota bacterium]